MKKFISGIIVGALLFAGASVFADSVGLVGKKVTGTYVIEKDGKKIADAAIINGSAYAPVRAVAQAAGVGLTVEGKKIVVNDTLTTTEQATTTKEKTLSELQSVRDEIVAAIDKKTAHIANHKELRIKVWDTLIKENPNSTSIPMWQKSLDEANITLNKLQAELVALQAQLADIDAQIAALQK